MSWLRSGRRRDACAVLYGTGGLRAQELKKRLEARDDTRIDPKTFYGALDKLVDGGYVERRTDGLHDVYELTEAGTRGVENHYQWLRSEIEA